MLKASEALKFKIMLSDENKNVTIKNRNVLNVNEIKSLCYFGNGL